MIFLLYKVINQSRCNFIICMIGLNVVFMSGKFFRFPNETLKLKMSTSIR